MDCNQIQQNILHRDWTAADLQAARDLLSHLDGCADCRHAVDAYDRLREVLHPQAPDPEPVPAGGWTAFESRLASPSTNSARRTWWRIPSAMAAGIALLLAGYGLATIVGHAPGTQGGVDSGARAAGQPTPDLRFTQEDASTHAATFRQVADVFGGRAQWVMVSDRASDVGVAQRPLGATRNVFVVRLVLSHGSHIAATSDVAIIPGQSADLRVPLEDGRFIRYRIGTADAAASRLSLWAELVNDTGDAEPIAALATQLDVAPGQTTRAGEMNTVSGPYRLSIAFAQVDLTARNTQ